MCKYIYVLSKQYNCTQTVQHLTFDGRLMSLFVRIKLDIRVEAIPSPLALQTSHDAPSMYIIRQIKTSTSFI